MYKIIFVLCVMVGLVPAVVGQKKVKAGIVAFYNIENLYDTINDPLVNDEEFLPNTPKDWNGERYEARLKNTALVISKLGEADGLTAPAVMGLCEIENKQVVADLVSQPLLKPFKYGIVHFDSPDKRGMDVALIYQPRYFKVTNSQSVPLLLFDSETNERVYTRDMLVVSGIFDGEPMHYIVNHWPSRRGGGDKSNFRLLAANRCRSLVDSILAIQKDAKIIVMGDLNDDPIDESVAVGMKSSGKIEDLKENELYNAMSPLFKNGIGTLAYRGKWNLFDQMLLTQPLVDKNSSGYRFLSAKVYNPSYLIRDEGQYKGYPLRTYGGDEYLGGYSDHLPVYLLLVK